MSIRYLTVDYTGQVHPVTYLRDRHDRPTDDPVLAERCIIQVESDLIATTTDDLPIYTVH